MIRTRGPYEGAEVVFATMHGKAELAREPFRDILGANVVTAAGLDTDQFGTFAGEIPRTLSPRAAARVKARLGMQSAGTAYGLASEASFGSGVGYLVEHQEILMFIDENLGLELVEGTVLTSALPPARSVDSLDGAVRYATAIDFPRQRLVVRSATHSAVLDKGVATLSDFIAIVERGIASEGRVTLEPDFRAHNCPTRAEVIASLAARMARRIATHCPSCDAPGFGQVDVERGLPCRDCLLPTRTIAADIIGCGRCDYTSRQARPDRFAEPAWCDHCNP